MTTFIFVLTKINKTMPESPEVRIIAEKLQKCIGYYIMKISGEMSHKINLQFPRQIKGVTVKGKKLIFILDNDIYLVNSLSMTGDWMFQPTKTTRITFELLEPTTNNKINLYYDDQRKFGTFDTYIGIQNLINSFKNKVGPDLLNEEVSYQQWKKVTSSVKDKQICDFLIEQKYFSGIGNEYRAEIAYHAGLNPTRLLNTLSEDELKKLYTSSITVLRNAYHKLRDTPNEYTSMVYNKSFDPYGNPIQIALCKSKRKVYWVPNIQK